MNKETLGNFINDIKDGSDAVEVVKLLMNELTVEQRADALMHNLHVVSVMLDSFMLGCAELDCLKLDDEIFSSFKLLTSTSMMQIKLLNNALSNGVN